MDGVECPEIPVQDSSSTIEAPTGFINPGDSTFSCPIDDADEFVKKVLEFKDTDIFDDDLEKIEWVLMTYFKGAIKFSGGFARKEDAEKRAQKISLDLFPVYLVPFGKWCSLPPHDTEMMAYEFVKKHNERNKNVKNRIKQGKDFDSYEDCQRLYETKDTEPEKESKEESKEENDDDNQDDNQDDNHDEKALLQKMNRAIVRGDAKKYAIPGQGQIVIAHLGVDEERSLIRVCFFGDDKDEVEKKTKTLYNTDVLDKRADYLVSNMGHFHPWPPNFMNGVERTLVPHNPSLERFYEASIQKTSAEYQNSLKEIEKFHEDTKKLKEKEEQENEKGDEGDEAGGPSNK